MPCKTKKHSLRKLDFRVQIKLRDKSHIKLRFNINHQAYLHWLFSQRNKFKVRRPQLELAIANLKFWLLMITLTISSHLSFCWRRCSESASIKPRMVWRLWTFSKRIWRSNVAAQESTHLSWWTWICPWWTGTVQPSKSLTKLLTLRKTRRFNNHFTKTTLRPLWMSLMNQKPKSFIKAGKWIIKSRSLNQWPW